MPNNFENIMGAEQLAMLNLIAQVGQEAAREIMDTNSQRLNHPYCAGIKTRIRTAMVQQQCEIESRNSNFPFDFHQRRLKNGQIIPELHSQGVILHMAQTKEPDVLPSKSKYKLEFSNHNYTLQRQMIFDTNLTPPYGEMPYYGILAFGGKENPFAVIQFPEPGYKGIVEVLELPQVSLLNNREEGIAFERKKAVLKEEYLRRTEGAV